MKLPLTRFQFVAYFIPGFTFLLIVFFSFYDWHFSSIISSIETKTSVFFSIIVLAISFFIGLVFDAFRNGYLEDDFDKKDNINWNYFATSDKDKIEILYEGYFMYYVFDMNTLICIILGITFLLFMYIFNVIKCCNYFQFNSLLAIVVLIIVFFVLKKDSSSLRKEISNITNGRK